MIDLLRRIAYQPVRPLMLGPYWSGIGAGFLSLECDGRIHITDAGRKAVADTRRTDVAESPPPAVFADQQAPS